MVQIKRVPRTPRRRSQSSAIFRYVQYGLGFYFVYLCLATLLFRDGTTEDEEPAPVSKNTKDLNTNYQRNLGTSKSKQQQQQRNNKPMDIHQVLESSKKNVATSVKARQSNHAGEKKREGHVDVILHEPLISGEAAYLTPSEVDEKKLVHIIHTRFMQYQPELKMLGMARLKLFETFCLPTMTNQRNQEYLWIIRTDPELDQDVKAGLLTLLKNIQNVVVVGSNEIRKGSVDMGFRSTDAISDITEESVFFGNMELVEAYYEAAKTKTLLETNLDADDGLATNFVKRSQEVIMHLFQVNDEKQRRKQRRQQSSWLTLCAGRHAEWQFYVPWDLQDQHGSLKHGSTHVCITAGLTWASQYKAAPRYTESHHLIKKETPACKDEFEQGDDPTSPTFLAHGLHEDMGCWLQIPTLEHTELTAIRARTPTSTGMSRVTTAASKWTLEDKTTNGALWAKVTVGGTFRIRNHQVIETHQYLDDNLPAIVEDNLKGQCQKDHSCSEGIKKKLKGILYKEDATRSEHGMIHIVQTAIETPISVDVWRHLCLESMEVQTIYDFLWIIRIKDFDSNPLMSDAVNKVQMLKILEKSALNIIVVKSNGTPSMDFRQLVATADINPESILFGSMFTVENFHKAAQNATLLETTLDPTEALSKTFIEDMQKAADVQQEYGQENAKFAWYYRCQSKFIEWNYFHPSENNEEKMGYARANDQYSDMCGNNPGTTRISMPGAQIPFFADVSQAQKCQKMVVLRIENGCYVSLESEEPVVARVVIPDSIDKPEPRKLTESELEEIDEVDGHLSTVLRYSFNILPYSIGIIHEHIKDIQCGGGNVCNNKLDSEYGVVHVVQTWIPGPDYFDIWRQFCFAIEAQTTKKFLWIIRIPTEADKNFIHQVAKPLHKTPLNVIIAKSSRASDTNFRHGEAISDINSKNLVVGDLETLQYFHNTAQEKPLIETKLDATVALAKTFAEEVQNIVAHQVQMKQLVDKENAWYYQCVSQYIEWDYHNPRGEEIPNGFLKNVDVSINSCLEHPGRTRVSMPSAKTSRGSSGTECTEKRKGLVDGCFAVVLKRLKGGYPQYAARVMVPKVIHGAVRKSVDDADMEKLRADNGLLRGHLKNNFGVYPVNMKNMRKKIEEYGVKNHGLRGAGQQEALSSTDSWSNSRGIVHVVHTRLLQRQPTLLTLGKVRLDIFKTLCLTTMSQQTNKQFLWIIRTDPELDPSLKENLLLALEGITNVVVIASRENSDGIYNGEFREHHAMREFNVDSIVHGNLTLVESFHEAAKSHILLETNIDSDDGVALTFVENLQAVTLESFERDSFKVGWVNLCLGRHLEWHFYAPWQKKSDKGCLLLGSTRNCVKSGLSWAVNVKAKPKFMTSTHLIKENKEQCSLNRTASERLIQECWDEIPLGDPENDVTAIRSMTPASNGIARGEVSKFDWNIDALKYDGEAWDLLEAYFAVNTEDIKESRALLVDNMHEVVIENDRSACTHEKTCDGHWKNKFRLVHVIHVSVFDPNLADVFRRVSLSSLVGQTSSEFLLIARTEDFTDQRLTDTLLKGIRDSAIVDQVLLVRSNRTHLLDFRSEEAISDITEENLLHGSMAVLKDYHDAAQNRTLLETYLHSFEGFKRDYVEELQNATATNIIQDRIQSGAGGWYYQCVPAYVERTYFSPTGDEQKNGYYSVLGDPDSKCMKRPGVTRISKIGSDIPTDTKRSYAEECSPEHDLGDGCFLPSVSEIVPALRVLTDLVAKPTQLEEDKIQELNKQQFGILRELRAEFSVFPPTLKNMRKEVTENERQIVHVIHTSLHDPAEINIWRHFLVDSLQLQTSKNFLYILRTTNFTNPKDMYNLMYPLSTNHEKGHIEAIVVDSNYSPLADFRTSEAIEDMTNSTLLRGEMNQLVAIHKAAGARTVVETFLGPGEGVASSFVADLQESVLSQLKQNQMQGVQLIRDHDYGTRKNWYYDCNSEFVEWHYHTPRADDNKIGFMKLITADHESNCVGKPGTTRVVLPGSSVPVSSEKKMSSMCQAGQFMGGCFMPGKMHDETKVAKAIIPASTQNAVPLQASEAAIKKMETQDKMLAKMLGDSFNISPYSIEIMKMAIHERECSTEGIQCTGHLDSQYGVVHIIQTSLQDSAMFDAWRKWCFALEAQTTHKFLYILRVAPGDEKLMKAVLKPVNKTPLNLIVVESSYTPSVDFRHPDAVSDITEATVRKGKLDMLQHYQKTAREKPLLETFLDIRDALTLTFVNDIQKSTPEIIRENKLTDGPSAWYYQCVPKYVAWNYFTPRGDESKGGFLRTKTREAGECFSLPGSTRISLPEAKIPTVPGGSTECAKGKIGDGCSLSIVTKKVLAARLYLPKETAPPPEEGLTEADFEMLEKDNNNLAKILKEDFNLPAMNRNQLQKKFKEILLETVSKQ
ncbi:unnamed protein product [Cylindrotheca closterium]|uniref:Uncharacterized protein n=1 Tax=Cylindrotheca closterium TaxID=2856 RepID=A0AAD2FG86_9STRA|nr:unnamed protein product [Cylindrotheca closterium]